MGGDRPFPRGWCVFSIVALCSFWVLVEYIKYPEEKSRVTFIKESAVLRVVDNLSFITNDGMIVGRPRGGLVTLRSEYLWRKVPKIKFGDCVKLHFYPYEGLTKPVGYKGAMIVNQVSYERTICEGVSSRKEFVDKLVQSNLKIKKWREANK